MAARAALALNSPARRPSSARSNAGCYRTLNDAFAQTADFDHLRPGQPVPRREGKRCRCSSAIVDPPKLYVPRRTSAVAGGPAGQVPTKNFGDRDHERAPPHPMAFHQTSSGDFVSFNLGQVRSSGRTPWTRSRPSRPGSACQPAFVGVRRRCGRSSRNRCRAALVIMAQIVTILQSCSALLDESYIHRSPLSKLPFGRRRRHSWR